jgi:Mg-chelatase subunit ChlD
MMHLPADQAAVVAYDAEAEVVQPLTGDKNAVKAALGSLTTGQGTRLDRGLETAATEFLGSNHRPGNRPVMVFLSDGRQVEERDRVSGAARFARSLGITIFTVALGNDADRDLLLEVAGSASRAYYAPGPQDLAEIYSRVAGVVRCR